MLLVDRSLSSGPLAHVFFQKDKMNQPVLSRIRQMLIAGALFLVAPWLTLVLLNMGYRFIDSTLGDFTAMVVRSMVPAEWLPVADGHIPGLSLLTGITLLVGVGALATCSVGRKVLGAVDALFMRIPIAHCIYSPTRKIIDTLAKPEKSFRKVVFIQWPGPRCTTMAFVTNEIVDNAGQRNYVVFVPQMPNPAAGFVMIVPVEDVTECDMSADEALRFGMSVGVLLPAAFNQE